MLNNKKGQGLALRTVVILVILLVAMMVVIGFFFTSTGKVFSPLTDLLSGSAEELPGKCVANDPDDSNCGNYDNRAECEDAGCKWETI